MYNNIEEFENSSLFPIFFEESLQYIDSSTPTEINSGGCGVFALLLVKQLKKYNIPYEVWGISNEKKVTMKMMQDSVTITDKKHFFISHIVVKVNDIMYVDSNGIENTSFYHADKTIQIPLDRLEYMVSLDKGIWNELFDRQVIPFIEEKLEEVFSNILNFHIHMYDVVKDVKYTENTLKVLKERQSMMPSLFSSLFSH